MKRLFAFALALTFGVAAFANQDYIPIATALQKAQYLQECKVAPKLGKEWMSHSIGAASITSVSNVTYTGNAFTPTPDVYLNGAKLTVSTDYTYAYTNNMNVGTAKVEVKANRTGLYGGQIIRFKILPSIIADSSVANIANTNYTGSAICPEPTVTVGGLTLVKGTDFTYAYADNTAAGSNAICIVTGKGNYTGIVRKFFTIVGQ